MLRVFTSLNRKPNAFWRDELPRFAGFIIERCRASLCMIFKHGTTLSEITDLVRKPSTQKSVYCGLEPPGSLGHFTVRDVLNLTGAEDHLSAVREWAEMTWAAWKIHHEQAKQWLDMLRAD